MVERLVSAGTGKIWYLAVILMLMISVNAKLNAYSPKSDNSERTFRMAVNRPEDSPLYKWVELIYSEVFRRMNIDFDLGSYPLNRASVETNSGNLDGEPARIYEYGDSFKNLLRVDESVFNLTVIAYSADPRVSMNQGWESLKDTRFSVEYPRGMKICENNLTGLVSDDLLSEVTETSQGLRRLAAGRIDIYVDDRNSALPILKNPGLGLEGHVFEAGIMEHVPLYMYVHNSRQNLIPQLERTIKALKDEGLIEEYRKRAFGL